MDVKQKSIILSVRSLTRDTVVNHRHVIGILNVWTSGTRLCFLHYDLALSIPGAARVQGRVLGVVIDQAVHVRRLAAHVSPGGGLPAVPCALGPEEESFDGDSVIFGTSQRQFVVRTPALVDVFFDHRCDRLRVRWGALSSFSDGYNLCLLHVLVTEQL